MGLDRRSFLKIAGVSALGLGSGPVADLIFNRGADALAESGMATLAEGRHWAMVIDLTRLTEEDLVNCARACHEYHNVPDIRMPDGSANIKEEIKWIWPEGYENAFPSISTRAEGFVQEKREKEKVLVLCNHCSNPPCVRVCPTKATFKSEKDGIVMMDMHRCIGCRFCMAACPYGSRSFNWGDPRPWIRKTNPEYPTRMKGVVEKCTFCVERLAKGLQPACVEAAESGALAFGDLANPDSEVSRLIREKFTIRRKPELGTAPNVYYIV